MKYLLWLSLLSLIFLRYIATRPIYKEGDKIRISTQVASTTKIAGLRVKFPSYPEVHYGDYIVVEGKVEKGELKNIKIKDLKVSNNIFISLRKKILDLYNTSLPATDAALTAGIVIGAKSDLPKDFYNKLIATGTSHIVVASGMNVTLVAGFVLSVLLKTTKRRKALIITLVAILIYCAIAGFEAPIVRAAIMASLAFLAQILGRVANTVRILFLTALFMLAVNPSWFTDIGFILSFATTLSLILFEKKVNRMIHFVPNILRENLSTSISAQIFASPIIFLTFGTFNPISPIINALVLWTVTPVMIIGGIGALIGLIFEPLGRLVILLVYPLTQYFIFIINQF